MVESGTERIRQCRSRYAIGYPLVPLFRRKTPIPPRATPSIRGAPSSQASAHEPDWRAYDAIAEDYARVHAPRTGPPARDLVEITAIPSGGRVLDVGTGTGVAARAAEQAGAVFVVGVDPSMPMLQAARREADRPRYAAAEAIDLPFRPASFDVVLSAFSLSHFARAETALFDMLRVLRPGGRLGVAAWGPGDDEFTRAWNEVAEEFAEHEILRDAYQRAMPGAERFSDPIRLKDALHDAGLRDLRVERREYRFEMSAEEHLRWRETAASGRFLHRMLGDELWETFRRRAGEVFAQRFPPAFNDFREAMLAAGHKPA
jgi:ubiquinone/menaquinone biosynthesis C-methylase UbiE